MCMLQVCCVHAPGVLCACSRCAVCMLQVCMLQVCCVHAPGVLCACSRCVVCMLQVCCVHAPGVLCACSRCAVCMLQVCCVHAPGVLYACSRCAVCMLRCPPALLSLHWNQINRRCRDVPTLTYLLKDYTRVSRGNAAIRGSAKIDLSVITGRKSRDCTNSEITE